MNRSLHATYSLCIGLLGTALIAPPLQAQWFNPVFEHLFNQSTPLPILKAQGTPPGVDDLYDGSSTLDSYGGLHRYDATRLMLGIRENGIDETDPNHDQAMAAEFPDRSILWIDPDSGEPMGVAIEVGFSPVPLDADFLAAGGTQLDYYFTFAVSVDGAVFVGYKNKILRYEPNGQGGFGAPSTAYTQVNDDSANWHQWRWENIRIQGSGAETLILAGGKTWRPNQGYHILGTNDGKVFDKFELFNDVQAGGGASSFISGKVADDEEADWVYASLYPGASNGTDTTFVRRVGDDLGFFAFENDGTFRPGKDPNANPETDYVTEFISDIDGDTSLGYIITYSTPSWNSGGVNRLPARPGFLGIHTHDGDVLGSHTLEVRESEEIQGESSSAWHGTLGGVEVNILEGMKAGQSEVLWASGIYGYGRYLIDGPPIDPVFEHLFNQPTPLPILKAQGTPAGVDDTYNGSSTIDTYGGLHRYDATRLMLAIRENGIDENDPAHDATMAASFPDRSLIWIDPESGEPMGIALEVGFNPVALDADFLAAGGTQLDYYFNFGIADDGVIYVGYKNKILRYAPDGSGSFGAPSVAYTQVNDDSANWHQWRWENIRVQGSGVDTLILAGGKTWRPNQGYHILATSDGKVFDKFELTNDIQAGGGASSFISGRVADDEEADWVYASLYPGASNGTDTTFVRRVGDDLGFFAFENDPTFRAEKDPNADAENDYVTEFISDIDSDTSLGYLVTYSTPSWNSAAVNRVPARPGFLGLHTHSGDLLGSHTLEVRETEELQGDAYSTFHGTLGGVEVNVLEGMKAGQSEVLWASGIYGYGRYLIGGQRSTGPSEPAVLAFTREGLSLEITWEGEGTLESSTAVQGPWTPVQGASSPYKASTQDQERFFRVTR